MGEEPGVDARVGVAEESEAVDEFDAIVLAGGRARRLGGVSKPDVVLAGRRLIDHTLDATVGAREVVTVGPAEVAPPGVRVTREDPPGGGPVAGLAAGLAALPDGAAWVLVLACDLPRVAGAVGDLLTAAGGGENALPDGTNALRDGKNAVPDGAVLVDAEGRRQPLAAVYRRVALDGALGRLGERSGGLAGVSMRALLADLHLLDVPDQAGFAADVDTWADVAAFAEVEGSRSRGRGFSLDVASENPRRRW